MATWWELSSEGELAMSGVPLPVRYILPGAVVIVVPR